MNETIESQAGRRLRKALKQAIGRPAYEAALQGFAELVESENIKGEEADCPHRMTPPGHAPTA